jgi:predicted ATPase/DNA-binding SARP family transcriptional activator
MAQTLKLTLFGSPEVSLGATPLTGFRSAKTQALLYYLAATGRPQPRTNLAGLFWGDVGDDYARRNLNRTLSNLTQLVGEHLTTSRQTLAFDKSQPYWLDVEQLESVLNAPPADHTPTALATALQLYRGDFLDGFYVHDAPEYEQWVLAERTRLRERYIQGLLTLASLQTGAGDLVSASDTVRRVLHVEPWREEAHRQLMVNLAQQGQRSAALAQYELCRQALAAELNVEPDATTQELVARIRSGAFDRATLGPEETGQKKNEPAPDKQAKIQHPKSKIEPLPHNLSLQLTPFVGRTAELGEVIRLLLEDADCRLLTLIGAGGMGKTRLALQAAHQLVEKQPQHGKFTHGLFFVSLEAVRDGNGILSAIISVISDEIGFPLHASAPLQEQLLDFLRDKAMLLVLDNFEHVRQEATLLSTMLTAAPEVKLLVTSREGLGLREAWSYSLKGLSWPAGQAESGLHDEEHDAVDFFVQCARRTQPDFALAAERAAVVRICQMVEGMPLAIELAAAWLKVLTPTQIAQELARGLDILTARFQNIPARHRSIRAVMESTWNLLPPDEREVAQRFSIFVGGVSAEAASAVAGASLLTLTALVEKALLRVRPDRRYQMHELTRQYAAERLGQDRALRAAYCRYYAGVSQRLYKDLMGAQSKAALEEFALVVDNILAAWHWLVRLVREGDHQPAATGWLGQIIPPLAEWYYAKGLFQTGRQLFVEAAEVLAGAGWATAPPPEAAPTAEQAVYAQLQVRIGLLTYELGQYDLVTQHVEGVEPLLRAWGNGEELALALAMLGKANYRRGQRPAARVQLQESLHHAEAANDLLGRAIALNNLSHIAQEEGDYAESARLLRECLNIYQTVGYAIGIGSSLGNLGFIYALQGEYERAQTYFRRALTVAEEQGDALTTMVSICNLGAVYRALGQVDMSIRSYQHSLQLARDLGNQRWMAMNLNGLSKTYLVLHDHAAATRHLSEALAIADKIASVVDVLEAVMLYAQLWMEQGQMEPALRALFFVSQHPVTTDWMHDEVQALLDELVSELPTTVVGQAKRLARAQGLEDVIVWVKSRVALPFGAANLPGSSPVRQPA